MSSPPPILASPKAEKISAYLSDLVSTLTDETPFISGVYELPEEMSLLFYGKETIGGSVPRPACQTCAHSYTYVLDA